MSTSTLQQQAAAVERMASNHGGHVRNLRDLVERGKRPLHELEIAEAWLPDLQAAAITIRRLANSTAPPDAA